MKKINLLFLLATLCLVACGPDKGVMIKQSPTGIIVGTVTVTNGDGEGIDYVRENVEVELTCTDSLNHFYNILMKQVSFSSRMPVTINMTIPTVSIVDGKISADSIVPYAGILGEYPKYTIRKLNGNISFKDDGNPSAITFDMMCGTYPTSYIGKYSE